MTTKKNSTSQRLQEIISKGTPRQKALLVCNEYLNPMHLSLYGGKASLTEKEFQAILDSLSPNESRVYNRYIGYHNVYFKLSFRFGLGYAEYERAVNLLIGLINILETYEQVTDIINSLYFSVRGTGKKEAIEAFKATAAKNRIPLKWGVLDYTKKDYYSIETNTLLDGLIKTAKETVTESYKALKALIIVIETFAKETRSKEFIFPLLAHSIEKAKKDYIVYDISARYSCRELRKRKEAGEKITEYEESIALFPEYDTLQVEEAHIEAFEGVLQNIIDSEKCLK